MHLIKIDINQNIKQNINQSKISRFLTSRPLLLNSTSPPQKYSQLKLTSIREEEEDIKLKKRQTINLISIPEKLDSNTLLENNEFQQ